jgi:hypothetical protein
MAAYNFEWNIVVDDVPYKITLVKNKIKVNNGEPIKYTKLNKAKGEGKGANYEVPVGNRKAILRINTYTSPVLTLDGRDCSTGEVYEEPQMPWWVFIHIILHAVGFFVLIGGALGGAIQGGVIAVLSMVASNKKKSTGYRVAVCTLIVSISLITQFVLAYFLATTFGI